MDLSKKIKLAMVNQGINQTELARLTEQTKSNLSNKLERNDFKLSEYERLVNALGCNLEVSIICPDGTKF